MYGKFGKPIYPTPADKTWLKSRKQLFDEIFLLSPELTLGQLRVSIVRWRTEEDVRVKDDDENEGSADAIDERALLAYRRSLKGTTK